ncbi:MAG: DUF4931 domain-containing protein [Planctomycetota bacterium]
MSEWLHDSLFDRTVRITPDRLERPSDFLANRDASACPFCAGAEDATPPPSDEILTAAGEWTARVVPNLYPVVEGDDGAHEVVIEAPHHALKFVDLSEDEAVAAWRVIFRRVRHWRTDGRFDYVLMFKNEGRPAGASLEHVHTQIVALPTTPEPVRQMWDRCAAAPRSLEATTSGDVSWRVQMPPAPRTPFETWITSPTGMPVEAVADDTDALIDLAKTLRATLKVIDAEAFNLVLQVAPLSAPDAVADRFWLEVIPRPSAIAGFELATGAWINERSLAEAREKLGQIRARLA